MADKALIVGLGEVGTALLEILSQVHDVYVKDDGLDAEGRKLYRGPDNGERIDFMHICFPYQDDEQFRIGVQKLQQVYDVGVTVVHSTVPVGTCRQLGAVHSPVMGKHPRLFSDMMTFTKFIGGPDASAVAEHLHRAGMRVYITDKAETTEAMKLLSTLFYAVCVEYTKDVKRFCLEYGLPFELWTLWTEAYNEGVVARGDSQLVRPNLTPFLRPLGGHCLQPNLGMTDLVWARFVEDRQE